MPKRKTIKGKRKAAERTAPRIENPSWLNETPTGAPPRAPIHSRTNILPFTGLEWENFERLCVRLAALDASVATAWAYGRSGHAQHGIDALVRLADGTYHVWQSKRHRTISKAKIKAAVDYFLKRKWSQQATRFVLAVACELSSPAVVEAIEAARDKLRERGIEFVPLGASQLTRQLVDEPELVDDFFGRPWVEAVCPPESNERLRQRLSRFDAAELRTGLRDCYSSWISTVDPGLPIVGVDAHGRTRASIPLPDRYVRAEFVVQSADVETAQATNNTATTTRSNRDAGNGTREDETRTTGAPRRTTDAPRSRAVLRERRMGLDDYLRAHGLSLVLGDAGTGKSTLLRFLALDILSDGPELAVTRDRYKDLIPVWLPFALWVRMSANQQAPVTIEAAVAEFLRAQGGAELAEHMRRAVSGKRVVLLVDGIDEATDPNMAQMLLAILTAFVDRTGVPVIATSRPHGVRSLTGLGGAWERATLAPLSDDQRHALASLWFSVLERFETDTSVSENQIRLRARRKADAFILALQGNAGIARLSQTPLFLLAFIGLHSRGQDLPRNRFAASKEIVEQLMEHQPSRRAVSALATNPAQSDPRLRDRIICDFAFALQSGELAGRISDAASEEDAIARGSRLILRRQNAGNQDAAEAAARSIFSFTEERAGLLVNKASGNVGFLHLSLQEYLAARHLVQFQAQEKLAFVTANAVTLRWREPILYLLAMTQTEAETGQLVEAIERAQPRDAAEAAARDALLADAVFADFAHDLGIARRIAANCLSEVESTAWGMRQQHLLAATVEGLLSESVGNLCQDKLSEWLPDRHGYGRETALTAITTWNPQAREAAIPALWRCLRSDNDSVWRRAAQVLPLVCERRSDVKEKLLRLARYAPSVQTAHAALLSVGFGWTQDEDVGSIARKLRDTDHRGLCLEAIRIRANRNETDSEDLNRFFAIAYERDRFSDSFFAPDLAEHFAQHYREAFAQKLETAISVQTGERHRLKSLVGALFLCNSESAIARQELSRLLDTDWMLSDLFTRGNFPMDRVSWTAELTTKVEAKITDRTRYGDHDLYQISKVLRLPYLKQRFLDGVRQGEHLCFWYSRGLAEVWGRDDNDVSNLFISMLDAEPKILSQIAQELPLMVDDRTACRTALLRGMRADVERYDFLLHGCKNLDLTDSDEEMVQAALTAGERDRAPLYRDMWCSNIILAFPGHPRVRTLATEELLRRDGSLGAVAQSYPNDPDMCQRVLNVLCPLDEGPRMTLVRALESAAISDASAYNLLMNVRRDTDGLVCAEGIMGGVEAMLARGPLPDQERQWLVDELDTVGPECQKRRMAAVIGLLLSGNIERFASARDYRGQPLDIHVNPDLTKEDIYLRRLMPRWAEMSQALGGEVAVLERLEITPERSLSSMHAGIPNARRLFDLLMARSASAQHLHRNDLIAALVEFAPRGPEMRGLLETMLRRDSRGRTIGDITAILRAGQVFADYFRDDRDLRNLVMDTFNANPGNAMAAGALAELLLREDNPELADSVVERVRQHPYDVGTNYKLMAVFASNDDIIRAIGDMLARDLEPERWAIPYWVPALVKRIASDATLQAGMRTALTQADTLSLKVSLWSFLGTATGRADDLRQQAAADLGKLDEEIEPAIGFDLLANSHRLLFQVLTEIVV
jgi:hypothetical protein